VMMTRRPSPKTCKKVKERAREICEYCRSPQEYSVSPFETEHVLPFSKGGTNDLKNLALACRGCNIAKKDQIEAFDEISLYFYRLFNPRIDKWSEHFLWANGYSIVMGLTGIGRVTVNTLNLNRIGLVKLRAILYKEGIHPHFEEA
jgi:HNH endonuclease